MKKSPSSVIAPYKLNISIVLALSALVAVMFAPPAAAQKPDSVLGVECSRISELGVDKQMNMRASLIRIGCGIEKAGGSGPESPVGEPPTALPVANVNTITGLETYPKVTQSESMVWSSDGTTIVVNYNDSSSSPGNYSGVSVSTDGGATFTRLLPSPFAAGHGTNYGDPLVVYNARLSLWFAGDMATGCGGQGLGLWTSTNGSTWATGVCAHSGPADDRPSMWVDNNGGSPYYGRMYISWNNFAAGQRIYVTYSDDGTTWSAPVAVSTGFIRNVQLTGSPGTDGTVFLAAMNEGGGGMANRTNIMYRSTDGGNTWTQIIMGAPFAPPGDGLCRYFARITPIWRHMGWGQPGVGPGGVIHYAYAGRGVNPGDTGDIYYTRSTDNGNTWSTPIVLNSDQGTGGTQAQWMPSLSVTASGRVWVSWYDRRNSTDGQNYEFWAVMSPDNGATWQADSVISNVLIPQPEQPDPAIQACYAGDYNYHTAFGETAYVTWTDGRNPVSGHFQQDVYFAALAQANPVPTITGLVPPTLPAGSAPQTLTINGTNFRASSTVSFNGTSRATTYVSSTTLTIQLTAADLTTAGAYPVVVTNPPPGGGPSNTVNFTVTVVVTINPPSASVGVGRTQTFTATVTGSADTAVTWTVQEGAAGGTITSGGVYTAPATTGTYHVVATSHADPTQSAIANVRVVDFSAALSSVLLSATVGGTAQTNLTVNSLNGFTDTLTFSCVSPPAGISCNFNPNGALLSPDGRLATTLVVNVASRPVALAPPGSPYQLPPLHDAPMVWIGAVLLVLLGSTVLLSSQPGRRLHLVRASAVLLLTLALAGGVLFSSGCNRSPDQVPVTITVPVQVASPTLTKTVGTLTVTIP